ncbi:MAG: hypothetical protein RI886_75 [Pseudomonadota bacterium]
MIYLASQSPRRSQILRDANISFEILISSAEEKFNDEDSVADNAKRLALVKAKAALEKIEIESRQYLPILSADTIVAVDGHMLGKPKDAAEARDMLKLLSNRQHSVVTGVALVDREKKFHTISVETLLYFKKLEELEIENYISTNEPYDKAGGISSQGGAKKFITKVIGSTSNLLGLPLEESLDLLKRAKVYS